jgi:hypothetical protein
MKFITQILLTVFLTISVLPAIAGEKKYALPNADYNAETPSEPCFTGTIIRVEKGRIFVSGVDNLGRNDTSEILIEENTSIFTVYGGYVSPDQLEKGIKLKVWFKGESCNKPSQPITGARIMIASKKPGDDWPK